MKYTVTQYQTSVNLTAELSKDQETVRLNKKDISDIFKRCKTCLKEKSKSEYRKRTTRRGKTGVWYDATCKDCHARTRGTKEIGRHKFAKELFDNGFRRCTICKEIKPLTEYYTNRAQHTGINHSCKGCNYTKAKT